MSSTFRIIDGINGDKTMKIKPSIIHLITIFLIVGVVVTCANAQEISSGDSISMYLNNAAPVQSDATKNPLKPPDTSSPQATLISFLDAMNRSYRLLMKAHRINVETPGVFTPDSVQHMADQAEELLKRGVYCLNLSEVPHALKRLTGYEGALKLKEILDRIGLLPFQQIPNAQDIEKEEEEKRFPKLHRWQVPNTDIIIARVEEGSRMGEYLFTPQTVARLDEFYKRVYDYSYKSDVPVSKGFLEFYMSTPGRLLPPKWSQWLPNWSKRRFLSQTIWQWFASAIICLLAIYFLTGIYRAVMSRADALTPTQYLWRQLLFFLVIILTTTFLAFIFEAQLNITGPIFNAVRRILLPLFWLLISVAVFFLGRAIAETIVDSPKIDPKGIQASYLRAVFGLIGFVAAMSVFIFGLSRVGVSLIPLLTGVGIGGLAVALAARPAIENVIASFMIFWDKPYRVGQRIKVMGQDGTVESIGLRSTRIRLLTGPLTSIPNEKIAAMEIENIGRRPYIRRTFNITITYDTAPAKIARAVEILREILAVPQKPAAGDAGTESAVSATAPDEVEQHFHPNEAINKPDFPPRVFFDELNSDSLNILVNYWYHPPEYWDYLEHAHWVNLQIMERFNVEGINFAFPTQTVHLAGDEKHSFATGQQQSSREDK